MTKKQKVHVRTNDTIVTQLPLEVFVNKKIGTSKKEFKKMKDELPCKRCLVLAACKGKTEIECDIILRYFQMCIAYGANTLTVTKEMNDLFPKANSYNGTIIL